MAIKRPKRKRFATDVEWHVACLRYLDAKWPGREGQRKRVAAFARWDLEANPERLRARLLALLETDRAFTDAEHDEFARLAAAWRDMNRTTQPREARP